MDWSKVDAALAHALAGDGDPKVRRLDVFLHLTPEVAEASALDALDAVGLRSSASGAGICTVALSAADVAHLTDQPWVRRLQLAQQLRPLGDEQDRPA